MLNWGLLGTARINQEIVQALEKSERNYLLAVASRTKERASRYATTRNIPKAYDTYNDLLNDPETTMGRTYRGFWAAHAARVRAGRQRRRCSGDTLP